jgi:hypothetical protein
MRVVALLQQKIKIIVEVLGNQPFPTLFGASTVAKRAGF